MKTQRTKGICRLCKKSKMVSKLKECKTCHDQNTISYWKDQLWVLVKTLVKKRDGDYCVTCGNFCEGANKHAGHFFTGASCPLSLYFDRRNIHVQDYHCNINLSGNWPEYYKFMQRTYGDDVIKEMWVIKDQMKGERWEIPRYKEEIEIVKKEIEAL